MAEGKVDVKFDREFFAVMVRACIVTNAVDTMLFGDVDAAKAYCHVRWKIPPTDWDAYLVASDPQSTMKLNGEGVRYCGWKHDKDETETIHIHLERKVVECSPKTLIRLAHEAMGKAANSINDLRHANLYRESDIQDMTNRLSDISKMIG